MEFEVEVMALARRSEALVEKADALRATFERAESIDGLAAQAGTWRVQRAISLVEEGWRRAIEGIADELAGIGALVAEAASTYRAADESAVRR